MPVDYHDFPFVFIDDPLSRRVETFTIRTFKIGVFNERNRRFAVPPDVVVGGDLRQVFRGLRRRRCLTLRTLWLLGLLFVCGLRGRRSEPFQVLDFGYQRTDKKRADEKKQIEDRLRKADGIFELFQRDLHSSGDPTIVPSEPRIARAYFPPKMVF